MASLSHVNVFSRDISALCAFYQRVFGFPEIESMRSPIYRLLDCGAGKLGFNAHDAYELLALSAYAERTGCGFILNFEVDGEHEVAEIVARALEAGGKVVKPPYLTYYGRIQAVMLDPESNVFRINYVVQPQQAEKLEIFDVDAR